MYLGLSRRSMLVCYPNLQMYTKILCFGGILYGVRILQKNYWPRLTTMTCMHPFLLGEEQEYIGGVLTFWQTWSLL